MGKNPRGCKELDMTEQTSTIQGQGQTNKKDNLVYRSQKEGSWHIMLGGGGAEHHQLGVRESEGVRSKCRQEVLL